jgi:hypothetical protein
MLFLERAPWESKIYLIALPCLLFSPDPLEISRSDQNASMLLNIHIYHSSLSSHPYTHLGPQIPLFMLFSLDQISRRQKYKRHQMGDDSNVDPPTSPEQLQLHLSAVISHGVRQQNRSSRDISRSYGVDALSIELHVLDGLI